MGRLLSVPAIVMAIVSAASAVWAEEGTPAQERGAVHPHGFISHGDSSGFMEDFYGDRVERAPGAAETGKRKYDPAVNWDDRQGRR